MSIDQIVGWEQMVYWKHQVPPHFTDHTYATKHGVALDLRIFPSQTPSSTPAPWVLYTHGGAFAAGKHYLPNAWVVPGFRSRGVHVVSVAYRLIPHVDLQGSLDDCVDAWKWCRENLPALLGEEAVDVEKCIVAGESAGGTLCTLLGHVLNPPPKVVVDIYGLVDSTEVRERSAVDHQPLTEGWSEEEVADVIKRADPAEAITVCPFQFDIPVEEIRAQWGVPEYEYTRRQVFQYEIKKYLRTKDLLFDVMYRLTGQEGAEEKERKLKALSAYWMLEGKKTYPPTYFLHGRADPVVLVGQAERMAQRLREMGVPVGESYEPGEAHEFDNKYTGPDVRGWDEYILPILDFVDEYAK
ncbi:Alpha/Beta hydrolase protein [Dioszegia hungarica]|uniref:Alpha/Beta hydrolase protein n=1 Tax=Dioszegia hungarica TaxID=4972 RepID=A0AA38H3W1_9TREE|nr:Alpha/Beta hydrolase protein [Dioszegia hungarica]KAI9633337.1 Alpha/Beta hydrolase protein [Dioszegia hungarica]